MACNERVGKGVITFACDLPERHDGPHRAQENPPSVREREKWEANRATLSQFQGPAQTTAERFTENPTPAPGTTAAKVQEGEPAEPPGSYQAWDMLTGRITKEDGHFVFTPQDDALPEQQISQREAIEMLDADRRQREAKAQVDLTRTTLSMTHAEREQAFKQREGDQPLPVRNDRTDIQSLVLADLEARREVGISRYGTALQAFNGRDMLRDAYEEALDLCVYLRGCIEERDNP